MTNLILLFCIGNDNLLGSNWKIYRNEKYRFLIEIPPDWSIKETTTSLIFLPYKNDEAKLLVYWTSGSLIQKGLDLWNFAYSYGFQNIENVEKDPYDIEKIQTKNGITGVRVVYWVNLINGERILSNGFVFFDTKPISDIRIVFENVGVDLKSFEEIVRCFGYVE